VIALGSLKSKTILLTSDEALSGDQRAVNSSRRGISTEPDKMSRIKKSATATVRRRKRRHRLFRETNNSGVLI